MIKWRAIIFMALSALSFAVMDSLLKHVSFFGGFQLVFFRAIASAAIASGYLYVKKIPFLGVQKKLMLLRSVVGFTSMFLFFQSVQYLPIGSAVSLRYLSPVFASIFAVFVLKERVKPIQWFFFFLAFIGVLMLKGFDVRIGNVGFYLIIGSAFTSGWVYILIRAIGHRDHPVVIINYFMWTCLLLGGLFSIPNWQSPTLPQLWVLLSLGVLGFFGQLFMTLALQIEEASKVAPFKFLEAVFVVIIAFTWLGESHGFVSLLAMGLIVLALLSNLIYRKKTE